MLIIKATRLHIQIDKFNLENYVIWRDKSIRAIDVLFKKKGDFQNIIIKIIEMNLNYNLI